MDAFYKEEGNYNVKGALKVNFERYLLVDAKINAIEQKGDAYVEIEFVKAAQKTKTEVAFDLAEPHKDVDLIFYPNFKQTAKKLRFSTKNLIQTPHLDSK